MDCAWLSDGEMERQEEEYRQDLYQASCQPDEMPFDEEPIYLPLSDYPVEESLDVVAGEVLGAASVSLDEAPASTPAEPGATPAREDLSQDALSDRQNEGSVRKVIAQPERSKPSSLVVDKVGSKRALCKMRSATVDPDIYAHVHDLKRKRMRKKGFQPMYLSSMSHRLPEANQDEAIEPKTKTEKNMLWNYLRSCLKARFKDSDEYQQLDWHSGASHWDVMRKGLSEYWHSFNAEMQLNHIKDCIGRCDNAQLKGFLVHLKEKVDGTHEVLQQKFTRFRASMCLCTWVTRRWEIPLSMDTAQLTPEDAIRDSRVVAFGEALGKRFLTYVEEKLKKTIQFQHYAVGVEVCGKTLQRRGVAQLHIHLFWHEAPDRQLQSHHLQKILKFEGQLPQFSTCRMLAAADKPTSSKSNRKRATEKIIRKSMFYILGPKQGQVWTASDQELDWSTVVPSWITELYASGKMDSSAATSSYLKCVHNARHNLEQLEYVERRRKEIALLADEKARSKALFESLGPRRQIPEVVEWERTLQDGQPRHKFLVLCGPSGMGKSLFALQSAGSPEAFSECDCSYSDHPNLRAFDRSKTKIVLFDECRTRTVLAHKRLFQGHVFPATLGESPTNRDAYTVCLHGVGVVIASNTWLSEIDGLKHEDAKWLQQNSVVVEATSPLYRA